MAVRIKSHIPIKIKVDDDTELELGVKRLSVKEAIDLRAKWKQAENAPNATEEERDQKDRLWADLLLESFSKYLRFPKGHEVVVELADGEEDKLKNPVELLELFGGRTDILNEIFLLILFQNSLGALEKKVSRLLTASKRSSGGPVQGPDGLKPETTADDAELAGSAGIEDVTALENTPSGSTDGGTMGQSSPSTNAPSVH